MWLGELNVYLVKKNRIILQTLIDIIVVYFIFEKVCLHVELLILNNNNIKQLCSTWFYGLCMRIYLYGIRTTKGLLSVHSWPGYCTIILLIFLWCMEPHWFTDSTYHKSCWNYMCIPLPPYWEQLVPLLAQTQNHCKWWHHRAGVKVELESTCSNQWNNCKECLCNAAAMHVVA